MIPEHWRSEPKVSFHFQILPPSPWSHSPSYPLPAESRFVLAAHSLG